MRVPASLLLIAAVASLAVVCQARRTSRRDRDCFVGTDFSFVRETYDDAEGLFRAHSRRYGKLNITEARAEQKLRIRISQKGINYLLPFTEANAKILMTYSLPSNPRETYGIYPEFNRESRQLATSPRAKWSRFEWKGLWLMLNFLVCRHYESVRGELYRGMRGVPLNVNEGQVYHPEQIMSTTTDRFAAERFARGRGGILFVIERNSEALSVSKAAWNENESEYLMGATDSFLVTNVEDGQQYKTISLRQR